MNPAIESLPLRDIHLPASVSWWPPALGWWLVLLLLLAVPAIIFVLRYLKKRRQFSRLMLAEFNRITAQYQQRGDAQKLLEELSALMRRVAVTVFPEQHAAGVTGDAWLRLLDELIDNTAAKKDSARFDSPLGRWLVSAPYQKRVSPAQQDIQQLLTLCQEWLRAVSRLAPTIVTVSAH